MTNDDPKPIFHGRGVGCNPIKLTSTISKFFSVILSGVYLGFEFYPQSLPNVVFITYNPVLKFSRFHSSDQVKLQIVETSELSYSGCGEMYLSCYRALQLNEW